MISDRVENEPYVLPVNEVSGMNTKQEVLRILQQEKPELVRRYGVKRLALFGSYAHDDQPAGYLAHED